MSTSATDMTGLEFAKASSGFADKHNLNNIAMQFQTGDVRAGKTVKNPMSYTWQNIFLFNGVDTGAFAVGERLKDSVEQAAHDFESAEHAMLSNEFDDIDDYPEWLKALLENIHDN